MARGYSYRRSHGWYPLLTALLTLLVYGQQHGWFQHATTAINDSQPGLYSVSRFVDGDTIEVDMQGQQEKVRFIGVDTPETHKPNTPVQCYGPAAAAFTKNTIGTQHIRLEADQLTSDRDRYNRLLRYVYLPDGTNLNEKLIREGYAFYYPYFPFSKSAQFASDQQMARAAHKGLWDNCSPSPTNGGGFVSNPAN